MSKKYANRSGVDEALPFVQPYAHADFGVSGLQEMWRLGQQNTAKFWRDKNALTPKRCSDV